MFPGGDVDVVRTADGDYWVHVRVSSGNDVKEESAEVEGKLVDARLDVRGQHASESDVGDFENPGAYHLVRWSLRGLTSASAGSPGRTRPGTRRGAARASPRDAARATRSLSRRGSPGQDWRTRGWRDEPTTDRAGRGSSSWCPSTSTTRRAQKRPRRIFVNSMSDLFHERLTNEQIASVFRVMLNAPRHTFQALTKRAERLYDFVTWFEKERGEPLPPHIWLGVSAEDQKNADARIPWLLKANVQTRFVSAEPLIGPIDFGAWLPDPHLKTRTDGNWKAAAAIAWVIFGGESGRYGRPYDVDSGAPRDRAAPARRRAGVPQAARRAAVRFDRSRGGARRPSLLHGPDISEVGRGLQGSEFPRRRR